jgi:predicted double-glycine peptidase
MMDDLQEMFMTKGKAKVVVEVRKTRKRLEVVRQNRNC